MILANLAMTNPLSDNDPRPEWWVENERLRQEMGIPPYTPPRFRDGVYTHMIVSPLEEAHDCIIKFLSPNATDWADWHVRVNGELVLTVERHRDENGNTVYDIDSEEFREAVKEHLT